MVDHLSTDLLKVRGLRWRIGNAFASGGESVFGESQTRRTSAGGRWFVEMGEIILVTADDRRLFEALLLSWSNGDDKVVLHRFAGPLLLSTGGVAVPFSDGSTFSDGSPLISSDIHAELAEPATLRATEITVRLWGARTLRGGEPFTIVGPKYGDRLYGVAKVRSHVRDAGSDLYELAVSPPLREAFAAGWEVDFARPRCTVKPDLSDPNAWPTLDIGDVPRVQVRFEETFKS